MTWGDLLHPVHFLLVCLLHSSLRFVHSLNSKCTILWFTWPYISLPADPHPFPQRSVTRINISKDSTHAEERQWRGSGETVKKYRIGRNGEVEEIRKWSSRVEKVKEQRTWRVMIRIWSNRGYKKVKKHTIENEYVSAGGSRKVGECEWGSESDNDNDAWWLWQHKWGVMQLSVIVDEGTERLSRREGAIERGLMCLLSSRLG